MSRYEAFLDAHLEINKLRNVLTEPSVRGLVGMELVEPLVNARIAQLMAAFDDPAPVPVEPVKPKAKRGDVDGAVKERIAFLRSGDVDPFQESVDWATWAAGMKLNRKSVLAAVRRHEKNKT